MRKVTVKIVPYGVLEIGKPYLAVVFHIEKKGREKALLVRLRHLDSSQDGRVQEVSLPLPVLPNGRTAQFLGACGANLPGGRHVSIDEVLGKRVRMVFRAVEDDNEIVEFMPIDQETTS